MSEGKASNALFLRNVLLILIELNVYFLDENQHLYLLWFEPVSSLINCFVKCGLSRSELCGFNNNLINPMAMCTYLEFAIAMFLSSTLHYLHKENMFLQSSSGVFICNNNLEITWLDYDVPLKTKTCKNSQTLGYLDGFTPEKSMHKTVRTSEHQNIQTHDSSINKDLSDQIWDRVWRQRGNFPPLFVQRECMRTRKMNYRSRHDCEQRTLGTSKTSKHHKQLNSWERRKLWFQFYGLWWMELSAVLIDTLYKMLCDELNQ